MSDKATDVEKLLAGIGFAAALMLRPGVLGVAVPQGIARLEATGSVTLTLWVTAVVLWAGMVLLVDPVARLLGAGERAGFLAVSGRWRLCMACLVLLAPLAESAFGGPNFVEFGFTLGGAIVCGSLLHTKIHGAKASGAE